MILNTLDFNTQVVENGVTKGTTPWFIKFYAPWCGHCKRMADDWGLFADKHRAAGDLNVGKIDCTADEGKAICQEFEVRVRLGRTSASSMGHIEAQYPRNLVRQSSPPPAPPH